MKHATEYHKKIHIGGIGIIELPVLVNGQCESKCTSNFNTNIFLSMAVFGILIQRHWIVLMTIQPRSELRKCKIRVNILVLFEKAIKIIPG